MKRLAPATLWGLALASLLGALSYAQSTSGVFMSSQTGITGFAVGNGSSSAPSYTFENATSAGMYYSNGTFVRGANGSGTNQVGTDGVLEGGFGTGTGNGGGVFLRIAPPGASGSSLNTVQDALSIQGSDGSISFGLLDIQGTPGNASFQAPRRAAGVSNGSGGNISIFAGQGTGTGVGGDLKLHVAPPAAGSGTTQNGNQAAITISGTTGAIILSPASPGGADPSFVFLTGRAFSTLGTPANGAIAYCSDCTIANPCAGSGNGALAKRLNGAWVCN